MLERVGLSESADRLVQEYSGGMRKRASTWRAGCCTGPSC
ncbi:hypothetical protein SAMN05421869_121175 [Nonomuraea jiangxiensis]|uniref:Uncharacterized protein n=1 Tax=Nonomuraea jiangxiensis TaxID=633440 RepID=A0A1G9GXJ9_9ACTN|nr:hypothetical protein SAMN05421869_121175 [Nonomuraea jiangxiensis]